MFLFCEKNTPKEIEKKLIQNVKTTPIKFDPTPIVPMPTEIYDPLAMEQERFNNLLKDCKSIDDGHPEINFAMHAKSLGANSEHIGDINELASALKRARSSTKSYVISLVTDSHKISPEGGCWWEVAVPEVSSNEKSDEILSSYKQSKTKQPY